MPQITFEQAKEFLENISSRDKIAIIHHDDLDGFASGTLLSDWCKKKGAEVENFIFSFGKWNVSEDLERFDKILIADISPGGILEIDPPKGKEIFYIDHHPKKEGISEEILEFRTTNEGYIPTSRTVGELTQIKPWLALAGTVADAGDLHPENKKYIKKILKENNFTFKEFEEKITHVISNTIIFFEKNLQKFFEELGKINSPKEVEKMKKYSDPVEKEIKEQLENLDKNFEKISKINIAIVNPKYSIRGILISKISRENPGEVFIFLSPKKSNPELLGISSRHQSDEANLPEILNAGIKGLENANAGGHPRAAGGQIQAKDLEKFKENIKSFVTQ
jgi:single-stranded DNA-specific DHH superfamily exonuclease